MAPARMMQFIDKHVKECETCRKELGLLQEVEKIREFILPESKIPKAVRAQDEKSTPEISPDEDEEAEDQYIGDVNDNGSVEIDIDEEP